MNDAVYRIVEHDGGWAYKLGNVFSETFPSRRKAEAAARRAAEEQRNPGEDEAISWEDEAGVWHDEAVRGTDRPNAYVAEADVADQTVPARGRSTSEWPRLSQGVKEPAPCAYGRGNRPKQGAARPAGLQLRSDPLISALLFVGLGFILGMLLRRRA